MLGANIARCGLRGCARPLARQPRVTNVRTAVTKSDGPDGTMSTMKGNNKSYALVGGLVLAVAGTYGFMMGKPQQVTRSEASPSSITERATADKRDK